MREIRGAVKRVSCVLPVSSLFAIGGMAGVLVSGTLALRFAGEHAWLIAEVVSIAPSRHFVMLDQPAKFQQALGSFLDSLQKSTSP